ARTVETVCLAIGEVLQLFKPEECASYLANSGYGATQLHHALVSATSRFYHRLVNVAFCRRSNLNRELDGYTKSAICSALSRHTRGAYRDRHGRWVRDAVDATASSTWRFAGRVFRERNKARRRAALLRTAK